MADDPKELTQGKVEDLLLELRKVGLYENTVRRLSADEESPDDFFNLTDKPKVSKRELLIIDLHVGDLAFAKRVQAPEDLEVDNQFENLTRQFEREEGDELQARISRLLAEGKDPFAEES